MLDLAAIDANLGSPDEDTRWQAAIALGEHCENAPEVIWPLIAKWGFSGNEDVRAAIATCVLEHILEYHFDPYFKKTAALIYGGNKEFADTFGGCWKFGQAKFAQNAEEWDYLVAVITAMDTARKNIAAKQERYEQHRRTRQRSSIP